MPQTDEERESPKPPKASWAFTVASLVTAALAGTAVFVIPCAVSDNAGIQALPPKALNGTGVALAAFSLMLLYPAMRLAGKHILVFEPLLFLCISIAVSVIIGRGAAPFIVLAVPFAVYRSQNTSVETIPEMLQWMAGGLAFVSLGFGGWPLIQGFLSAV